MFITGYLKNFFHNKKVSHRKFHMFISINQKVFIMYKYIKLGLGER
jgi:hypothetical protein